MKFVGQFLNKLLNIKFELCLCGEKVRKIAMRRI